MTVNSHTSGFLRIESSNFSFVMNFRHNGFQTLKWCDSTIWTAELCKPKDKKKRTKQPVRRKKTPDVIDKKKKKIIY